MSVGWQVNNLDMYPTTVVNSAFYPSKVGKSSTSLSDWGYSE